MSKEWLKFKAPRWKSFETRLFNPTVPGVSLLGVLVLIKDIGSSDLKRNLTKKQNKTKQKKKPPQFCEKSNEIQSQYQN